MRMDITQILPTTKTLITTPLNYSTAATSTITTNSIAIAESSLDDNRKIRKSKATVYIPTIKTNTSIIMNNEENNTALKKSKIITGEKCSSLIEVNHSECASAVTGSVSSSEKDFHVVKIKISPEQKLINSVSNSNNYQKQSSQILNNKNNTININTNTSNNKCCDDLSQTLRIQSVLPKEVKKSKVTIVSLQPKSSSTLTASENDSMQEVNFFTHYLPNKTSRTFLPIIEKSESNTINNNNNHHNIDKTLTGGGSVLKTSSSFNSESLTTKVDEMVQKSNGGGVLEANNSTYLYYMMTSGQCSPSDTLDSGTCSDMENSNNSANNTSLTPPPLPKKIGTKSKLHLKSTKMVQEVQNMKNDSNPLNISANNSNNNSNQQHHNHSRTGSLTDSEESESSLSCDSLNSSECARGSMYAPSPPLAPITRITSKELNARPKHSMLPDSLLRDIRDRKFISGIIKNTNTNTNNNNNNNNFKDNHNRDDADDDENNSTSSLTSFKAKINVIRSSNDNSQTSSTIITPTVPSATVALTTFMKQSSNFRERNKTRVMITKNDNNNNNNNNFNNKIIEEKYENDKFYTFHINEMDNTQELVENEPKIMNDETFAGFNIHTDDTDTSTIRSSKGTVRGVKNRVRNGIATFLQMQQTNVKSYKEKDCGKVVLYTTSMGIVRETYAKCSNVKQILRTLLIKFEERDVFMSGEYQQEIRERMQSQSDEIQVPQLFVEGQYIGDAEIVERLNESGELRKMLKQYKSITAALTCQVCGGYRLLPCPSCNGSKKSVHRNHFTAEFVALKCMNCDEVGLVKCHNC